MSMIWHIVKKDLRHVRVGLAIWLLVLAAKFGLAICLVHFFELTDARLTELHRVVTTLGGIDVALTYLLAAFFVLEDGVAERNAFWMTRPVSGARLFAAKCVGIFLTLGLGAVLVPVPWWLTCGFTGPQMMRAATETLGWQVIVIAPAVLLASLTNSAVRLLLWTCVLVVAIFAMGTIGLLNEGRPIQMAAVPAVAVVMFTAVAVAAHQFLTRRLVRSIAGAAVGIAAALMVTVFWRWDLRYDAEQDWREMHPERAAGIKVEYRSTEVVMEAAGRAGETHDLAVVSFRASGLPEELALVSGPARHTWTGRDGLLQSGEDRLGFELWLTPAFRRSLGLGEPRRDAETETWWQQRRVERGLPLLQFEPSPVDAQGLQGGVRLWPSVRARLQRESSRYDVEAVSALWRPRVLFEVPMQRGGWVARDGYGVRVIRIDGAGWRGGDLLPINRVATVIKTEPSSWLDEWRILAREWGPRSGRLVVLDRPNARLEWDYGREPSRTSRVRVGGITLGVANRTAFAPRVIREDRWTVVQENWIDQVRLVAIDFDEMARFKWRVTVDPFLLPPRGARGP